MPRRDDLHKILIIGSGPIVIGQACEFDYSGTQACKVLLDEGYEVVLVNSNPATIMTDPEFATRTYIEPLDLATVTRIIEVERPDALLPTLGGQTALNLAMELKGAGVLDLWEVEMIGADEMAIHRAEDRLRVPHGHGGDRPARRRAAPWRTAWRRPSRPARSSACRSSCAPPTRSAAAAAASPTTPRASAASSSTACSSAPSRRCCSRSRSSAGTSSSSRSCATRRTTSSSSAPSRTSTPWACTPATASPSRRPSRSPTRQYQELRDAAKAIIRKIGVDTGGSNVQFAVNPDTGEVVVIEMNPRVSRSSALASKATGFPIAKIAARLAVGYTLDEIDNDITQEDAGLLRAHARLRGRQDAALGLREVPARRPRAHHAHEERRGGDGHRPHLQGGLPEGDALARARRQVGPAGGQAGRRARRSPSPRPSATSWSLHAFRQGMSVDELHKLTGISPFFLSELRDIVELEREVREAPQLTPELLRRIKRYGFSDQRLGELSGRGEREVRALRLDAGVTAGLQGGRHVRRRVPGRDAVLLLLLRGGERGRARREGARRHPRHRDPTASARASSSTTAACTPR